MNIFDTLAAGDSAAWPDDQIELPDGRLVGSSAWSLKYYLRGPSTLDLTAAASGTGWATTLTTVQSAGLAAGLYAWTAIVAGGASERITVGTGQLTITPDVTAQSAGVDPRSTAQRALAQCESAMATFNSTGGKVRKYTIGGREMEFQTIGDLMRLHAFWAARVMSEGASAAIAQGLGNPRNLFVRFQHPQ
jgi:hypothetical protein